MSKLTVKDVYVGEILEQIEDSQTIMSSMEATSNIRMGFTLKGFFKDENLVGYALFNELAEINISSFLDDVCLYDEVDSYEAELADEYGDSTYLKYFEIFEAYQGEGLGTEFFNKLFGDEDVVLYSLSESINFWESLGFEVFNDEEYYLVKKMQMVA